MPAEQDAAFLVGDGQVLDFGDPHTMGFTQLARFDISQVTANNPGQFLAFTRMDDHPAVFRRVVALEGALDRKGQFGPAVRVVQPFQELGHVGVGQRFDFRQKRVIGRELLDE
jgi:hypothetical protein